MTNFYPPNSAIDLVIEPRPTMLDLVIKGSVPLPTATRADMKLMHYLASLRHSRANRDALNRAGLLADSLFIETPAVIKPTRFALETSQLQNEYYRCWQNLKKHFSSTAK